MVLEALSGVPLLPWLVPVPMALCTALVPLPGCT